MGLVGIQGPNTRGGTLKSVIILGTFLSPSHLISILAVHKMERMELRENPAELGLSRRGRSLGEGGGKEQAGQSYQDRPYASCPVPPLAPRLSPSTTHCIQHLHLGSAGLLEAQVSLPAPD